MERENKIHETVGNILEDSKEQREGHDGGNCDNAEDEDLEKPTEEGSMQRRKTDGELVGDAQMEEARKEFDEPTGKCTTKLPSLATKRDCEQSHLIQ